MKEQTREDPKILAAAERQMQAWSMTASIEDDVVRMKGIQQLSGSMHSYLAISREAGAGGSTIAEIVGRRLGWDVLDKELLDRVAKRFHNNRMMLELVDETPSNWIYDVLGTWMDSKIIPHETYVVQLSRVVLAAAKRGNAIFVGRGAQFLLPREKTLVVRLVAAEQFRVENLMRVKSMTAAEAQRYLREVDQGRLEFGRRFFHHDVADPHLYDLVLNTGRLGMERAAELILAAIAKRFHA
ncbi:MAG: cytidylate kinase-like family protein [Pirellulales bacterium]|nr:cytidylate kinase-like family protein [Pirellulales bacterium]